MPPELGEMELTSFLNALPGAISQGLVWGIMAIGVYITYKLLDIADLTVDGSFCTGGAVGVMMMVAGHNVWLSLLCAILAGMLAGLATGVLHTACGIPAILAGILTQLGLWSVNLAIMGMKANQSLNVNNYELLVSLRYLQDVSKGTRPLGVPSQGQLRILRTGRCCEGSTCQFLYALFVVLMFPTTPMSV